MDMVPQNHPWKVHFFPDDVQCHLLPNVISIYIWLSLMFHWHRVIHVLILHNHDSKLLEQSSNLFYFITFLDLILILEFVLIYKR